MNQDIQSKNSITKLLLLAALLGVAATAFLDVVNYMQHIIFNKPLTRYEFIGRWVIYMIDGVFSHQSIKSAPPRTGELMLGWFGHYAIGVGFALLMLAFTGFKWIRKPTFAPAFIVGLVTCSIPFFIMYPGMGYGIAGLDTPNPTMLQIKVLISHFIFSVGLFIAGWVTKQYRYGSARNK